MKLTFYGAVNGVTGSNYLLESGGMKILVDCGLFQGSSSIKRMNFEELPYSPADIDLVLLTHAHIDHSGRIPLLYKKGYKGDVISTKGTKDLCGIMLPDSAYIQESEAEYKNKKRKRSGLAGLEPLYTVADAMTAVSRFIPVKYDDTVRLNDYFSVRFKDAGHILGSASLEIWCEEEGRTTKIVFSGDIGKKNTPIIKDPACINEADYLVMESTYGAKRHEFKENADDAMFSAIEETLRNNGTVIIPSFAVGRT
ncbi:MAG: MBL fold metallo-hydrolase, partial [Clostridia bacterium]|nr:MBL fold metallo-hydrolase [Clostridia bacterium]